MFFLLKKIDAILVIIFLTTIIGIVVITMRSKTYSIGYEIAELKNRERQLLQRQIELEANLTELQRKIRGKLISRSEGSAKPKFVFPDDAHILRQDTK